MSPFCLGTLRQARCSENDEAAQKGDTPALRTLEVRETVHRSVPILLSDGFAGSAWEIYCDNVYLVNVSKWGNSLAVRLPAAVVEALELKEGDEIQIGIAGKREFVVSRDRSREKALETIRRLSWKFPKGFKLDREEANER